MAGSSVLTSAFLLLLLPTLWLGVLAQCDPSSSTINTDIKLDSGRSGTSGTNCYFPFTYSGDTYTDCVGDPTSATPYTTKYCDGSYCNFWCATSCNYPSHEDWNFCKFSLADMAKTNCSGLPSGSFSSEPALLYSGTGSGTSCYFPFVYNGACHYDCITTTSTPWCATTDVTALVNTNYKYCRYTIAGKNDPSCAAIDSTAPYYIPPQEGTYSIVGSFQNNKYGNCTFPFYYKEKCYDDCITIDAHRWYLPWCSTEQYYEPNQQNRVCPYYRKYRSYTGLALSWGFYRIYYHSGCGSSDPLCNMTLAMAGSGVPDGAFGSSRMILSSTNVDVVEVMPQANGFFILRLPLPCATNFVSITTDSQDIVYDFVSTEREFWDIKSTSTSNVFTMQSTWNASSGYYFSQGPESGFQVAKLSSSTATEWRFQQLTTSELASLSLPCEDPTSTVNGEWCAWSAYTYTVTTATRNRTCNCPAPSSGGANCSGSSSEVGTTVNGTWCAWSSYTVSGAYGTRIRECNCSAPAYGGLDCAGSGNDTSLVVNAGWCAWSSYTIVGAYATRNRTCACPTAAYGGSETCAGSSNDTGLTVNGSWCSWSGYTVSGAYGTRTRECNCSAPAYAGANCSGSGNDTGLVVNGTWCAWSSYTVSGGYATRLRTCACSAEAYGGLTCQGSSNDTGAIVNGAWCTWSDYTVSAGVGTRTRNCSCPSAAYTGATCSGNASDSLAQVNASWCAWSSLTTGYGVLTRTRDCTCPTANVIGYNCTSGVASEEYPCNISACQTTTPSAVDGQWCAWGAWVAGLANSGVMSRSRTCACPAAMGSGEACSGSSSEVATCELAACRVFYAVPAEKGTSGAAFENSDTFNRLIIWCTVVSGCILVSTVIGLALMCRQISNNGA